jgi:ribonucleotide reductase alpha subunit
MPLGSASLLANNVSSGLGPVTAAQAPAQDQLHMQATAQGVVDGAVVQPVYLPADADRAAVEQVLLSAWHLGLKACTVVRESGPAS